MTIDRPQRIVRATAPGALLKRLASPAQPRKQDSALDPDYLALVRQCPCLKCGMEPAEAAHVRMSAGSLGKFNAMGKKPSDAHALPLCSGCHRNDPDSQHRIGEVAFWNGLGLNPLLVADRLYAQRGDLVAMRAVIFITIAERGKAS